MTATLGVILGGGTARRMGGGDKGLLTLGGRTILSRVVERLAPQVGALALNANDDPRRFADVGLPVLADPVPDRPGPLAGVLAGLIWAEAQGARQIVTAAWDTPFLPVDLVARLDAARSEATPIVLAASGGHRHPTFGLWPVALKDALRRALDEGTRKIVVWTDAQGCASVDFAGDPDPFFNVNTPEDLAAAEAML